MAYKLDKQEFFVVVGMGAEPTSRADSDGGVKLSPSGKPTYRVGGVTKGERGADSRVVVHSCSPNVLELGVAYRTAGDVWITPWVDNGGRLCLSVVCEELEPVKGDSPVKGAVRPLSRPVKSVEAGE